ncbi:MAG: hypothetical protein INR69_14425 [Mucilaginibacter polytrichastri]|nr:hypothetical protein [Mucilaginibacter polytrichastri]
MKKHMYFLSLFCSVLFIAACCKQENVYPRETPPKQDVLKDPPVTCDSTKDVQYVLKNNSLDGAYSIILTNETHRYAVRFPQSGELKFAVKPGIYTIYLWSGDGGDHLFALGSGEYVRGAEATFINIKISACTADQSASVD